MVYVCIHGVWMYWFVNGWRAWYYLCEYKDFVESVYWCSHVFKHGVQCNYDILNPCGMNNFYILYNNYVFNNLIIFQLSLYYAQLSSKYMSSLDYTYMFINCIFCTTKMHITIGRLVVQGSLPWTNKNVAPFCT